jgi:hypothetical protein
MTAVSVRLALHGAALLGFLAILLALTTAASHGRVLVPRARSAAKAFRFEDLEVVRERSVPGRKTTIFLISNFRLNRALPFAPRGRYESEEEGVVRAFDAYISIDGRYYEEGSVEAMGDDPGRHCYTDGSSEIAPSEYQPRIGDVVRVSLVLDGHSVLTARTRVRLRKLGPTVREPGGSTSVRLELPYEVAFGCLK